MKPNLFLLIFLLSALGLTAQNSGCTITGVVREYDLNMHKQALDGVEVRISVGGTRSDITENGGHFTIENIPYCKPGTKIQTDKNSFLKPGYELFYPDALDFWRVPNSTAAGPTEILMCKSSRINEVRQKLFKVVDQHHKKLYEQKKAELEQANLEKREMERQLIILESQLRDTARLMAEVNEWLYLDRLKCDSVLNLAYSYFEDGNYDKAREIMNSYEMKSAKYYLNEKEKGDGKVEQALKFVKHRLTINFGNGDDDYVIHLIERDCDFLIDIYSEQLERAANDTEGMRGDTNTLKKNLAAAYALKGDISTLCGEGEDKEPSEHIANYRKAAALGNAHAQYKMGEIHENCLESGISYFDTQYLFNLDSARYWYSVAAAQNDANAMRRMETFYDFDAKDKNGNDIFYHILPDKKSVAVVRKTLHSRAYAGNIVVPKKVKFGNSSYRVTTIEEYAFARCENLQNVTIPKSVNHIGEGAFAHNSVCEFKCETGGIFFTIEDGTMLLENINQGCRLVAFATACDIHDVILPNSVTAIEKETFAGCLSLQSVNIPNSVTSIGDDAFTGCGSLESITIPNSVTSIGKGTFRECSSLESITIPNSVTTIGEYTFASCYNLESITIPNSVTTIGNRAFWGCENLQNVTIPNSVTTIGEYAFLGCENLQNVTIPNSVTSIGDYAFSDCENLQSVTIPNSVTSIEDGAFAGCRSLQNITVPNSVTTIGEYAFKGCSSLQNVTIPNSVTTIGKGAFNYCAYPFIDDWGEVVTSHLYSFKCETDGVYSTDETGTMLLKRLNEGYELVGFASACDIHNVTIPNFVTIIGEDAFILCENLQSVTIPNSVTSIGDGAFYGCGLQSLNIPNSVTSIGDKAFMECVNLQSVNIPNSVTSIGYSAFRDCVNLQSVNIPNSVTSIGDRAFWDCVNLQSVTIPNSVTSIGDWAFSGCGLQSVNIPNSVTTIGDFAFAGCRSLQSVTIPNSVTSIGDKAFMECVNLQSVTIPNSVTTIGEGAFYGCGSLQSVRGMRTK